MNQKLLKPLLYNISFKPVAIKLGLGVYALKFG